MNFTHSRIQTALVFSVLLIVAGQPGCESQPAQRDRPNQADPLLAGWTIVLNAFDGPGHQAYAQQQASQFTASTGMTGFWVSTSLNKSEVNFGRYDQPNSPAAKADLDKLKTFTKQGRIAPPMMTIVPAHSTPTGSNAQWELRSAREDGAIYTLVIADFTPAFGPSFRQQAEQECASLRSQGVKAFFFHSPRSSIVTIEQFTNAAAKIATEGPHAGRTVYHPFITDTLQKQYPYLKVNGQVPQQNPLPTFLFRIPE